MSPFGSSRRRPEEEAARADALVRAKVDQALSEFQEALERTVARVRADSLSLLAEEERRIAEERRTLVAQWEHVATAALAE